MLHEPSSSCVELISAPQKHCPAYSVPATGYPRLSQKATQASLVTCGPLKFDHWGRVRGKTVSVKQPEYDQEGSDVDGGVAGEDGAEGDEAGAGGDVGADETECAG